MSKFKGLNDKVRLIWSVADLLRGDYKADEYSRVILPLAVLRRLDCMLEPTNDSVLATARDLESRTRLPLPRRHQRSQEAGECGS